MSLFGNAARSSSKNLVEFKAGKMKLKGTTVTADKRKGQVYIHQADDSLMHFCWKDRTSGNVEDDLIIFPDDCELTRVAQCTTGRVFVLKFKSSSRKMFFWMQEPKTDKDEDLCKKVNESLNNPPQPGQGGSGADLGGLDAMGQGNLQDLFNNMDQQQLLQLMASGGLGNLLSPGRMPGGQQGRRSAPMTTREENTRTTASRTQDSTTSQPASTESSQQAVQLSQLQDILSQMEVPKQETTAAINLAEVITPEVMIPILADPKVQERLKPFLPAGEVLGSTEEELRATARSPHFKSAMSSFSSALASGQLGPLLAQFGLPAAAVEAANKGDVEAFAKAMQDGEKESTEENMMVD